MKSYGGVSYDATASNHLQQPSFLTYNQQIQQPILPFPFYGFNFYQQPHQPVRTYGGIVNNNQQNPTTTYQQHNGFGWFGAGIPQHNQDQDAAGGNAAFPTLPNYAPFVYPQFTPQFYNPPQFPFPNFNLFPFGINNGVSLHPQPQPQQPNPVAPPPTDDIDSSTYLPPRGPATESTFIINETTPPTVVSTTTDEFLTNSLFGEGSNADRREWTAEDEQDWQATTKAPYFDNKVPGMDCALPAAAVLGELLN